MGRGAFRARPVRAPRAQPPHNLLTAVSRFGLATARVPSMRDFREAISSRVVVYDGGMGATLEQFELSPDGLRGARRQVPRGARPAPSRRDRGRSRLDARRRRRRRRDRHIPGLAPEARRVGARRAHARDQREGRADRTPRGGRAHASSRARSDRRASCRPPKTPRSARSASASSWRSSPSRRAG